VSVEMHDLRITLADVRSDFHIYISSVFVLIEYTSNMAARYISEVTSRYLYVTERKPAEVVKIIIGLLRPVFENRHKSLIMLEML